MDPSTCSAAHLAWHWHPFEIEATGLLHSYSCEILQEGKNYPSQIPAGLCHLPPLSWQGGHGVPGALAHSGRSLSSRGGFFSLPQPLPLSTSQALVGTGTTGDLGAQQGRGKGSAGMEPLTSLQQVLLPWLRLGRAAPTVLPQLHHPFPNPLPIPQLYHLIPCPITPSPALLPPPLSC